MEAPRYQWKSSVSTDRHPGNAMHRLRGKFDLQDAASIGQPVPLDAPAQSRPSMLVVSRFVSQPRFDQSDRAFPARFVHWGKPLVQEQAKSLPKRLCNIITRDIGGTPCSRDATRLLVDAPVQLREDFALKFDGVHVEREFLQHDHSLAFLVLRNLLDRSANAQVAA